MSSVAFSVDWNGRKGSEVKEEEEIMEPKRAVSEGQGKGEAWEISFNDSPGQVKPRKFSPKFVRESKSSPVQSKASPVGPSRSKTTPSSSFSKTTQISPFSNKSNMSSPRLTPSARPANSMRSSSSPMKASGPHSYVKPGAVAAFSKPRTIPVPTRSLSERNLTPKKQLPMIRKPLLPVTSPTKKTTQIPELRSRSDSILSLRAPNKTLANTSAPSSKKVRPQSSSPSVLAGRKPLQKVQSLQQLRPSQENKHFGGFGGMERRKKEGDVKSVEKGEPSKKSSLPVVSLTPIKSAQDGARPAQSPSDMAQRKVLDLKRWYCMSHPQYSKSCGISSVVSCWNYLFSTLGNGSLPPVSQEEALALLGFEPPFGEIRFGPFTGNMTCMRWFNTLCDHYGTSGRSYYFYKPVNPRKTVGMKPSMALEKLQEGLNSADTAFIYHCYNHYFCPIGYENVPKLATDAYRVDLSGSEVDTWILIGEPSRTLSPIHCKRWDHIVKDLMCELPQYFNIRHTERGILTKTTKRTGTNLHCIMAFKKIQSGITTPIFRAADASIDMAPSLSEVEELNSSDSDLPGSPNSCDGKRELLGDNGNVKLSVDDIDLGTADSGTFSAIQLSGTDLESTGEGLPGAVIPEGTGEGDKLSNKAFDALGLEDDTTPAIEEAVLTSTPRREKEIEDNIGHPNTEMKSTENVSSPISAEVPDSQDGLDVIPSVGALRRSGTFTKEKPTVERRRSGTFTKEKPTIERRRPPSSDSDSSVELMSDSNGVQDGANSPQEWSRSRDSSVQEDSYSSSPDERPTVTLKRSNTFTKEKPTAESYEELGGTCSPQDEWIVSRGSPEPEDSGSNSPVESPPTATLKRSGTFTKEKPSVLGNNNLSGEIDLDETLKASDFF